MRSDGPNRVKKLARIGRRAANIQRRLRALEDDFDRANSVEAELRINEAIARQNMYLLRVERKLAMNSQNR